MKYFAEDLKVIILPDENILANSKEEIRAHMKKGMEDGTFQERKLIDIKAPIALSSPPLKKRMMAKLNQQSQFFIISKTV